MKLKYIFSAVLYLNAIFGFVGQSQALTGKFLVVSDIHLNPFAGSDLGALIDVPVEYWEWVMGAKDKSFSFGSKSSRPYGSDSNYKLFKSAIEAVHTQWPTNHHPDFILYPGDFIAHNWDNNGIFDNAWNSMSQEQRSQINLSKNEASKKLKTKLIQFMAMQFKKHFPNTPIFPTLGNDDSYDGDYQIQPNGEFLSMFANAWAGLNKNGNQLTGWPQTGQSQKLMGKWQPPNFISNFSQGGTTQNGTNFHGGGFYSAKLPIPGHRLIVLNSVFFVTNGYRTCNDNLGQINWLKSQLQTAKSDGEKVWLLMHVPPGIDSFAGNPFWCSSVMSEFKSAIKGYDDIIKIAFAGHTHMDDFRVLPTSKTGSNKDLLVKIAPSISPIFKNNPGFQVFDYDTNTGKSLGSITNYTTYYLTNLKTNNASKAKWAKEYSFTGRNGYVPGAADLNSQVVKNMVGILHPSQSFLNNYNNYYPVSSGQFTPGLRYACAILNANTTGYNNCNPQGQSYLQLPQSTTKTTKAKVGKAKSK